MNRLFGALLLLASGSAQAGPLVSIIIDDLGNRGHLDRRAVALPGPVAMSVLPHTPHARHVAERARRAGKEILVHLPMQSEAALDSPPGTIALHDTRRQLEDRLRRALEAVPHAVGVNNHMGSLITRHPGHMAWLMKALAGHPHLFFVDSRTTKFTVAGRVAGEHGVPSLSRDVFLDDNPSREAVEQAFDELVDIARQRGRAVAIGHPRAATLDVLEERLPELANLGVTLVPLSEMLESRMVETEMVETDRVKEERWLPYSSR
jgi:polysaccharide deacetylase 2 family uncharacterized protein YibQ